MPPAFAAWPRLGAGGHGPRTARPPSYGIGKERDKSGKALALGRLTGQGRLLLKSLSCHNLTSETAGSCDLHDR